jgi:mannose-1-phosphate guanylyltransferase/mannose-6-phosphate isomerase
MSRAAYPKQFLPLNGAGSLLQDTLRRGQAVAAETPVVAVANAEHRFLLAEQLRQAGVETATTILEPASRNTAPAVAVAAMQAIQSDPDALLLVMPSDHAIDDEAAFRRAVEAGRPAAEQGQLVTFGVVPQRPETGYGYIRYGAGDGSVYAVEAFVEKPDAETAERYLADGSYLWNSGIFLFRAQSYLEELAHWRPAMRDACEAAFTRSERDMDFLRLAQEAFEQSPDESIDYAVMENTERAAVVSLDCGWSDLGSWAQVAETATPDGQGNVLTGDVLAEATTDSYVYSDGRLVATIGVSNQIVVETDDAVLVADRERAQDVKKIVERLEREGRYESNCHQRVYRPWGSYQGIAEAERFQVKRIVVDPGQKLSVQMHHHRAEHWVVVTGTAKVHRGEEHFLLTENQSTYIPLGEVHCLENPGVIPLELIEVQSGGYLGEDDIVRFEDVYGRVQAPSDKG